MCNTNQISLQQQYSLRSVPLSMPPLDSKIDVLTSVDVEVNGVLTRQSKYVTDDSAHRYDGVIASDFEPSNVLNSGIDVKPIKYTLNSFDAVAYAELSTIRLANKINSVQSSKTE